MGTMYYVVLIKNVTKQSLRANNRVSKATNAPQYRGATKLQQAGPQLQMGKN